ncbi:MAG TPA: hypothetical protein VHI77_05395 [Solirubrobacterales bacterium]|jgi:hypothetical protein|nr:hypothetical protein [Solirubrobacterales bacterium]
MTVRSPGSARAALGLLFVAAASTGLPAALFPRTFYDDFPFLAHWVDLLPPYNHHLVTDVGGLYLGFAVLFAWALWTLDVTLVRAACAGWLLMEALHLIFHATHLEGFSTADGVAEIVSLTLLLLAPLLAIWAVGAPARPSTA